MPSVDGVLAAITTILHIHHRHHLAFHIIGISCRHLSFLHQLEQGGLNATPADISTHTIAATAGKLVDFIDINNAILRQLHITLCFLNQFPNKVVNIAADITCL